MKQLLVGAASGALAWAAIAQAQPPLQVPTPPTIPPPSVAQPSELEVQIGKNVYPVRVNQPLTVTTPKGERLQLLVRRKDVLQFSGAGIRFNYPRQMRVSTDPADGATTITAEALGATLALIQVYHVPINPAQVRKELAESFRKEFKARGGRPGPTKKSQRRIGGAVRPGETLEWVLAGERLRSEIYVFPKGSLTLAVVLQRSGDEETEARRYFAIISDSLK